MSVLSVRQETLAAVLWPAAIRGSTIRCAARAVLLALIGSALLTVSAKIQVPFYPVPMTMQTFAVLALAAIALPLVWRLVSGFGPTHNR